jgi:hypothetical protein
MCAFLANFLAALLAEFKALKIAPLDPLECRLLGLLKTAMNVVKSVVLNAAVFGYSISFPLGGYSL